MARLEYLYKNTFPPNQKNAVTDPTAEGIGKALGPDLDIEEVCQDVDDIREVYVLTFYRHLHIT